MRYADCPVDPWRPAQGNDGFFGCDAATDVRGTWGITPEQCAALAAFLAMEQAHG